MAEGERAGEAREAAQAAEIAGLRDTIRLINEAQVCMPGTLHQRCGHGAGARGRHASHCCSHQIPGPSGPRGGIPWPNGPRGGCISVEHLGAGVD